jgi:hypothetical protein
MSHAKPTFIWTPYERVTIIDMKGGETVKIRLLGPDIAVPDNEALKRYYFTQSHLDRLDAQGLAPPAIRIGIRAKARMMSSWYRWELEREIPRKQPLLVAPPAPGALAPPRRKRGRPPKIRAPVAPAAE